MHCKIGHELETSSQGEHVNMHSWHILTSLTSRDCIAAGTKKNANIGWDLPLIIAAEVFLKITYD